MAMIVAPVKFMVVNGSNIALFRERPTGWNGQLSPSRLQIDYDVHPETGVIVKLSHKNNADRHSVHISLPDTVFDEVLANPSLVLASTEVGAYMAQPFLDVQLDGKRILEAVAFFRHQQRSGWSGKWQ